MITKVFYIKGYDSLISLRHSHSYISFDDAEENFHSCHDMVVIIKNSNESIATLAKAKRGTSHDVMLTPIWIMDALGAVDGNKIECIIDTACQVMSAKGSILFKFLGWRNEKHWDEHDTHDFESLDTWHKLWPSGLNVSIVEAFFPSMITRRCFIDGQLFNVDVFDMSMMFRIHSSPYLAHHPIADPLLSQVEAYNSELPSDGTSVVKNVIYILDNPKEFSVEIEISHMTPSLTNESSHKNIIECSYINPLLSKISSICDEMFKALSDSTKQSVWHGPHSVLIAAPEGAGKTRLLSALLRRYTLSMDVSIRVVYLSADTLSSHQVVEKSQSTRSSARPARAPGSVENREAVIMELIENLCRYSTIQSDSTSVCLAAGPGMKADSNANNHMPVLVVLDDADRLLSDTYADSAPNTEDSSSPPVGEAVLALRRLLSELSSSNNVARVMLVAATRRPLRSIPAMLTSPPGFELLFELPRPSRRDRVTILREILQHHISGGLCLGATPDQSEDLLEQKCVSDSDVFESWAVRGAAITPGYLPGDLQAVMRLAVALSGGRHSSSSLSNGSRLTLLWEDMLSAVRSRPPRQLQSLGLGSQSVQEGASGVGRLGWEDYGGYLQVKTQIMRLLRRLTVESDDGSEETDRERSSDTKPSNRDLMRRSGDLRGIVLHGPSGNGKTFLAQIIANETSMNFVTVRSSEVLSRYFGQTENAIRELFAKARAAQPCVLFFDDFDSLACKRGLEGEEGGLNASGLESRVLSTFLNELDGISSASFGSGVLLLVACASVESLDEALVRPGRLQHQIYLGAPSETDLLSILQTRCRFLPIALDVKLDIVAQKLFNCRECPSCADVDSLLIHTLHAVLKQSMQDCGCTNELYTAIDDDSIKITRAHFESAFSTAFDLKVVDEQLVSIAGNSSPTFTWSGSLSLGL